MVDIASSRLSTRNRIVLLQMDVGWKTLVIPIGMIVEFSEWILPLGTKCEFSGGLSLGWRGCIALSMGNTNPALSMVI